MHFPLAGVYPQPYTITMTKTAAAFNVATLAPMGSLARVEQAQAFVEQAMFRIDDYAVEYAKRNLIGWNCNPLFNSKAHAALWRLIQDCQDYLAQSANEGNT
jgi:hypothetical protein